MILNNLKIYCQTEDDQSVIFGIIFSDYQDTIDYSSWKPDGDKENPYPWGLFIDNFPLELWNKLVKFLNSKKSLILDKSIKMVLECKEAKFYEYYP